MVKQEMVRLVNTDIPGELPLVRALIRIKGIGWNLSKAICNIIEETLNIDRNTLIGDLEEDQIQKIGEILENLEKYLPPWLLNRRFDPVTGETKHLMGADIDVAIELDIDRMKRIKCFRGIRHMWGLPVRGQRTRSSFRSWKKHKSRVK